MNENEWSETLNDNDILFGIDKTENIVSCEVQDDSVELFIEKGGKVESKFIPHRFWTLSNKKYPNIDFQRLEGNLHYKYRATFETEKQWRACNRQLQSRRKDFFTVWNVKEQAMLSSGFTYFKGMQPKDVSIMVIDLETNGFIMDCKSDIYIIATTTRKNGRLYKRLFCYDKFETRAEMIQAFVDYVHYHNPSILLTYNGNGYDWPFLQCVADNVGVDLALGRDHSNIAFRHNPSEFRKDGSQSYTYKKVACYGRELIDGLFLAIRYDIGRKYYSYALKKIMEQEGLLTEDREIIDFEKESISDLLSDQERWEKFKKYAIADTDDTLTLFDKHVTAQFYAAQNIAKPFQVITESATGSQVNSMMIRAYYSQNHSIPKASPQAEYEGAISMGNPGIYKNVRKVDVASLYPSIMLTYEIYDRKKDPLNVFLRMLDYLTKQRLEHKKLAKTSEYYDGLQQAEKQLINSAYGFCGSSGLLFNSPKDAAEVTRRGREILQIGVEWATGHRLKHVVKKIKNKGKENEEQEWEWKLEDKKRSTGNGFILVNTDTDSFSYVDPNNGDFSEQIKALNGLYKKGIKWEDDGLFELFGVIRAKNYFMLEDGKLKIKGSGLKATSKEIALKEFLDSWINLMLKHEEVGDALYVDLESVYEKYTIEAVRMQDIRRWTSKKTVTKAVFNPSRENEAKTLRAIQRHNKHVQEGDKIRTFFLPNGEQELEEKFNGQWQRASLLEKLWKTANIFSTIIDMSRFPKYSNKGPRMELAKKLDIPEHWLYNAKEYNKYLEKNSNEK